MTAAEPSRVRTHPWTTNSSYRLIVAALVVMSIARGLLWASIAPPFQMPDEPAHLAYTDTIRREHTVFFGSAFGSVALANSEALSHRTQVTQNRANAGPLALGEIQDVRRQLQQRSDKEQRTPSGYGSSAASYPPLFYTAGALIAGLVHQLGGSYLLQIELLRYVGVILAAIALVLQVRLLEALLGRGYRSLAGGALIALMPMYAFMSASYNPDGLMGVLVTLALLQAIHLVREGFTWRRALVLAGATACALLTKQTGLVLLPVLLVVGVATWRRDRDAGRRVRAQRVSAVGAVALVPFLVFRLLDTTAEVVSSIPLGGNGDRSLLSRDAFSNYLDFFDANKVSLVFNSFWGNYGWLDTSFPPQIYIQFLVIAIAAAFGLITIVLNAHRVEAEWLVVIAPLVTLALMLYVIEYAIVNLHGAPGLFVQGRYFFPLIAPLVALYVVGVTRPFRHAWIGRSLLAGSVVLMAAYHVATVVHLLYPRYDL